MVLPPPAQALKMMRVLNTTLVVALLQGNYGHMRTHHHISEKPLNELNETYRRSALYQCLCKLGVKSNLRALVVFDDSVPAGYILALEGLLYNATRAYQCLGYCCE